MILGLLLAPGLGCEPRSTPEPVQPQAAKLSAETTQPAQPEPPAQPASEPLPGSEPNTAAALVAAADRIETVELLHPNTKRSRGSMSARARAQLSLGLAKGRFRDGYVATGPPFSVVLRIEVEGREAPFIAHFVGQDTLRLNPVAPWSDRPFGAAEDVTVGMAVYDTLAIILGELPRKEFLPTKMPRPSGDR